MKKTMFITSVIMVVVLAIALTTSSLAWFSAGGATNVNVSNFTLATANAEAVSGLEISKTSATSGFSTSAITLDNGTGLVPVTPVATSHDPVRYTNSGEENAQDQIQNISDENFYADLANMWTAKTATMAGSLVFKDDANTVSVNANSGFYKRSIWVRNSGAAVDGVYINCTPTISAAITNANSQADSADAWVAVFALNPIADSESRQPGDENYVPTYEHILLALASSSGNSAMMTYCYKDDTTNLGSEESPLRKPTMLLDGHAASAVANKLALGNFSLTNKKVHLEPAHITNGEWIDATAVEIEVYTWFDGADLIPENNDTVVTVSMQFDIVSGN